MKKSITFFILFLLIAGPLCGCSGAEERSWKAGQKALAEENYSEAASAFSKAGSFQDSERLLMYSTASLALENGDYAGAFASFQALGNFKDSALMVSYCSAMEKEALAGAAFSSGDDKAAVSSTMEAYQLYQKLSLFRDCDTRFSECRDFLYSKSSEWMSQGRYESAASGFAALGDWADSASLQKYCTACTLEAQASYPEAAEIFSQISGVLDADSRAESARDHAYQLALELKENGDYGAAIEAFEALGSYRDSDEQRISSSALQIKTLLSAGRYAEALNSLNLLADPTVFPKADPSVGSTLQPYLESFVNVWMNAHAGVMNAFFSCNLLQPYIEPGGELDTLLHEELNDDAPLNYGFVYYGTEVSDYIQLDDAFTVAKVTGSASYIGPEGSVDYKAPLQILIDSSRGYPIAAAVLSE